MATEILSVPEGRLEEVVAVIRLGLERVAERPEVTQETIDKLTLWCDGEMEYLLRIRRQDR